MIHHSSRQARKTSAVRDLNLTSCIDIVFLLLVYFIITVSFPAPEGSMAAPLPGTDVHPVPRPQLPLKIHVTSMGETGYRLDIQGHPVRPAGFGDLIAMMKRLRGADGTAAPYAADDLVLVAPGDKVRWQHVVNAYNASRRAGFTQVTFDR
jgi:biopolymer transport protein ExbD